MTPRKLLETDSRNGLMLIDADGEIVLYDGSRDLTLLVTTDVECAVQALHEESERRRFMEIRRRVGLVA